MYDDSLTKLIDSVKQKPFMMSWDKYRMNIFAFTIDREMEKETIAACTESGNRDWKSNTQNRE